MARRKKTAAAPKADKEELLKKALVPEDEQPYTVPSNWCWVRLGTICDFERGITFPASSKEETATHNNIACLRTVNVQEELDIEDLIYINRDYIRNRHAKLICKDDIVMSIANSRELVGKTSYIHDVPSIPMTFGAFLMVLRANIHIRKYIYYFLRLEFILGNLAIKSSQTVNIANISTSALNEYKTPFPPLPEQRRIVERIESLFSKLDAAKEKIQNALDGCELRKAAILKKAFNGELTEQWRKEHGISKDIWEERPLKDVCDSIYDGDHLPPPKSDSGIPFLVISNVNTGYLSFDNTRFVSVDYYDSLKDTRKPKNGDVLYTLVGSYGIPVLVDTYRKFCFQRHMALLKPRDVMQRYLWYALQNRKMYDAATNIATGTAQLTVPIKGLRELKMPYTSLAEQKEIVRLLDGFFEKERTAKEAAEQALAQIEYIKKSILAKAFRGELGTNAPQEESSLELLKQIIETGNS